MRRMPSKSSFFSRHARLILLVVVFFVALTGWAARLALQGMKNDVKDWLPADFVETAELDWFRRHFLGEQFVVVSWPGCYGGPTDTRFQLFMGKLQGESPPSAAQTGTDRDRPQLARCEHPRRHWRAR